MTAQNGSEVGQALTALINLDAATLVTPTGLNLEMLEGLSYDQYEALGVALSQMNKWTQWAIADWLLYGDKAFAEVAAQAALATKKSEETVRKWLWVAERVAPSRRNKDLSFSTHEAVAALPAKEQRRWLKRAADQNLSQREVRILIREEAKAMGVELTRSGRPRKPREKEVVVEGLPTSYVLRGALCRRLVSEAIGTGDAWVKVPREIVNEIAAVIGADPI